MPRASLNLNTFPHFSPTFTARHASMIHPGSGRAAPTRRRARDPSLAAAEGSALSARPSSRPRSSLLSQSLALALLSTWPFMRRSRNAGVRRRQQREREKLQLCCWQLSPTPERSGENFNTGDVDNVVKRQMNDCSFVRSFVSPLLDRTDHGRQNRTWKRLDDVNECESVKLCLNGDVSDVWLRCGKGGKECSSGK